jgi:cell division protein FtsL
MNRGQQLIQAYRQAPWRQQVQWIGLFLIGVIFLAVIAGLYLSITARAAEHGRRIQAIRLAKETTEKEIQDLESRLAELTSIERMDEITDEMGFHVVNENQVLYLIVPGYPGRQLAWEATQPEGELESQADLPPEFTQSLLEWLGERISQWAGEAGIGELGGSR